MSTNAERTRVLELARVGARIRLTEIETERKSLLGAFPELKLNGVTGHTNGAPQARPNGHSNGETARRRMSPKARRAVSLRMTKYWAARREAVAKTKSARA